MRVDSWSFGTREPGESQPVDPVGFRAMYLERGVRYLYLHRIVGIMWIVVFWRLWCEVCRIAEKVKALDRRIYYNTLYSTVCIVILYST